MTQPTDITQTASLHPGRVRLARGLAALVDERERHPTPPSPFLVAVAEQILSKAHPASGQLNVKAASAERGTAKQAATILGLKPRKLQTMSQRGEIPGAAKLGRQWTFDLAKLRRFVEQQEQACQNEKLRPDAIGAVEFSGAKLRLKGSALGGRLGQMIQQSQRRVGRRAKSGR